MKIRQSSAPYLFLLLALVVGIPTVEFFLQKKSTKKEIIVEVDGKSNAAVALVDCAEAEGEAIFTP